MAGDFWLQWQSTQGKERYESTNERQLRRQTMMYPSLREQHIPINVINLIVYTANIRYTFGPKFLLTLISDSLWYQPISLDCWKFLIEGTLIDLSRPSGQVSSINLSRLKPLSAAREEQRSLIEHDCQHRYLRKASLITLFNTLTWK